MSFLFGLSWYFIFNALNDYNNILGQRREGYSSSGVSRCIFLVSNIFKRVALLCALVALLSLGN